MLKFVGRASCVKWEDSENGQGANGNAALI